jgi:hypothetical protein
MMDPTDKLEHDGGLPAWMVMYPESVARIVDESLREDVWWIAVRAGLYAQGSTVWADCVRPPVPFAGRIRSEDDIATLLRRGRIVG